MEVDLSDVAIVRALEPKARALLEAITAAMPSINRLSEAGYAGAEWLSAQASATAETHMGGSLGNLAQALTWFREAAGDEAAWDYRFFGLGGDRMTLVEAAADVLSWGGVSEDIALQRVEALRQYAATA